MKRSALFLCTCMIIVMCFSIGAFAEENTKLDSFKGIYRGWYYANQGHTGLTLEVYKNDKQKYEAAFNFYSVPENPSVPSGRYICDVYYDVNNDTYNIVGTEWVKQPNGYIFVDLRGTLSDNVYKGDVLASNRTFSFELVKQVGENATSEWADGLVNSAVIDSYVPLELQSNYKANITRADFARLAVAGISLKTNMSIEDFMRLKNIQVGQSPFVDTDDQFVLYANALGIVKGYGNGKFGPTDYITREQSACMLEKLAILFDVTTKVSTSTSFNDEKSFSIWAKKSINFVTVYKDPQSNQPIMVGSNNAFNPKAGYTREQAIVTIYRLVNSIR